MFYNSIYVLLSRSAGYREKREDLLAFEAKIDSYTLNDISQPWIYDLDKRAMPRKCIRDREIEGINYVQMIIAPIFRAVRFSSRRPRMLAYDKRVACAFFKRFLNAISLRHSISHQLRPQPLRDRGPRNGNRPNRGKSREPSVLNTWRQPATTWPGLIGLMSYNVDLLMFPTILNTGPSRGFCRWRPIPKLRRPKTSIKSPNIRAKFGCYLVRSKNKSRGVDCFDGSKMGN